MARFTSRQASVSPPLLHAIFKLTFVGIAMADGAGAVLEAVQDGVRVLRCRPLLMAISARRSHVSAG